MVEIGDALSVGFVAGFVQDGLDQIEFMDTGSMVLAVATGFIHVAAFGTLTLTSNASNGDTVTIGTKTYTLQTVLTNVDGNVLIGATASISIDNLIAAITLGGGAGTLYATATTLHPTVTAEGGTGDTMLATANERGTSGNSIATTETGAAMSWGAATLLGGVNPKTIGANAEAFVRKTTSTVATVTGVLAATALDHQDLTGLLDDDHTQYELRTQPITTFAGGTLTLANADAGTVFRCTAVTTVEIGDALDVGFKCGFVQDGVGQITYSGTGAMVLESFSSAFTSPFKTAGDGAEAHVRKTTATAAVVTGVLETVSVDHGTLSGLSANDHPQYHLVADGRIREAKGYAKVNVASIAADTDVGGVGGGANLDAQLPDMNVGTFLQHDVFVNGLLKRPGADAAANFDYYPGTSLANGQLKFEFTLVLNDVICVVPYTP
jgi:hypothetical protein